MDSSDYIQELVNDFVFIDCRLQDHPTVRTSVYWMEGERLILLANTQVLDPPHSYVLSDSNVWVPTRDSPSPISLPAWSGNILNKRAYLARDRSDIYPDAFLGLPIFEGETAAGVLKFESFESKTVFSEKHLGLAQLLAAVIAYSKIHLERKLKLVTPMSVSLGRALRQVREEIGLTQLDVAAKLGGSRIAISRWENGAQPPSRGQLYKWCKALGLLMPSKLVIVKCVSITSQLLRLLKEDATRLRELSPAQLEQFVAERLDRMGFDVTLTGSVYQRDGGIDLIAVPKTRTVGTFLLAGQVKHHRGDRKTGREAVDRLLSWKDSHFSMGLLVTNTGFTKDALWVAAQDKNKAFLRLRGFDDLVRWIEDNFWSEEEWREIPDEVVLAPGVIVKIPKPRAANSLDIWPIQALDPDLDDSL